MVSLAIMVMLLPLVGALLFIVIVFGIIQSYRNNALLETITDCIFAGICIVYAILLLGMFIGLPGFISA